MVEFDKPGEQNTAACLRIAFDDAAARGIKTVVVASTRGDTARKAVELMGDASVRLIVVTHNYGFGKPGEQEFDPAVRDRIRSRGGEVLSGTMALRNVGCAIRKKLGYSQEELINATLRMFCQGAKVGVEMAAMVSDAGLVGPDEDIITVAGTARGADTAMVVRTAPSNLFFDIKIRRFLAKPVVF